MVTTDGDEVTRAPVRNVPVVFPSGGGFALTFPLRKGDPVLLVYSQRGLARWKKAPGVSTPDVDGFFSEKDAIAIPGFGDSSQEPGHLIEVGPEGVRIMTSGTVAIEAQDVTFKTVGTDEAPESIT